MRGNGRHGATWLARAAALAMLTLALALSGSTGLGVASAGGTGGSQGTLKVHEYGTPSGTESNDPKVCTFNLEGFGFTPGHRVALAFTVQGGDGPTGTLPDPNWFGPYVTDAGGSFASEYFNRGGAVLAAGHYKATAYGKNGAGGWVELDKVKSKVFKVSCATPEGTVTVTKVLAEGSQPAGDTLFPVTVTCAAADYSRTFDLAVGQSATTQRLPAGTVCTVAENQPQGWDPPTYRPSATVTVQVCDNVEVRVVNNRPAPPAEVAGLTVTKANAPTGTVAPGDVIVYTLTTTATGNVSQDGVTIADVIPDGVTYVAGSAVCIPAAHTPCAVTYDSGSRLLTVMLGTMAPGDQLGVAFSVRVDTTGTPTSVTNVGRVKSARAEATSNPVTNNVAAVLGEKITKPGTGLAATGSGPDPGELLALALGLALAGLALTAASRPRGSRA